MKHTLRCHDFGLMVCRVAPVVLCAEICNCRSRKNRAIPQGVAAKIAARFVANLANTASIGGGPLRASDDSDSQRARVSLCQAL
jgi:hypothetical protein